MSFDWWALSTCRNEAHHEHVGGGGDGSVEEEDAVVTDQVTEGREELQGRNQIYLL